jgi:hypothetical protein
MVLQRRRRLVLLDQIELIVLMTIAVQNIRAAVLTPNHLVTMMMMAAASHHHQN